MAANHLGLRRLTGFVVAIFVACLSYAYFVSYCHPTVPTFGFPSVGQSARSSPGTLTNLHLTAKQCKNTFPDLSKEIDFTVSKGHFRLLRDKSDRIGNVQGRIKDGKLFIISVSSEASQAMAEHRTSTLSQLYRAVSTSPELLPDTYFSLNIHDNPQANSWVYSRPTSPQPDWQRNYWVMPPFSLWTWTSPFLGTMDDVLSRIQNVESSFHSFSDKRDQAVWRGTPGVNPVSNIRLRQNLISLAEDKGWADVAELSYPRPGESGTGLRMEDHCRYKYIIYTEGVTYSGRLPYHQACASILITPPLLHHTYSTTHIRPLFSSTLDLKSANFSNGQSEKKKWAPNYSGPDESWPRSYPPGEANAIFVAHDWSDLEAVIQWLRDHADVAAGIANRQRDSVVHGGYLSQAAEACYWRALIRGWASVADVEIGNAEGQWNASEGIRFEQYLVRGKLDESSVCKGA